MKLHIEFDNYIIKYSELIIFGLQQKDLSKPLN